MRLISLLPLLIAILNLSSASAETAQGALERMLTSDMMGDPTVRIGMSAPDATSNQPPSTPMPHLMTFFLGSSQMALAMGWRIERSSSVCLKKCQINVAFRVVALTSGDPASYANGKFTSSEIVPLEKPTNREVTYELTNIGHDWMIQHFPEPYVNPKAVADFYRNDMKSIASIPASKSQGGMAAYQDRQMIIQWEMRQLAVLARLIR